MKNSCDRQFAADSASGQDFRLIDSHVRHDQAVPKNDEWESERSEIWVSSVNRLGIG